MTQALQSTLFFQKTVGSLMGGLIGDAIGTPTEGVPYPKIEEKFGWVADFDCDGTDDTVMKYLLAEALIRTEGYATYDDWAQVWLDQWDDIFGDKVGKFFQSVLHTAVKLRRHSIPRMAALGNMPSSSSAMCISPVGIVNAGNPRQAAEQTYNLASLIHVHDVSFCQDGAAAMAAATAAAFLPAATVDSILDAAVNAIVPVSGQEMLGLIQDVMAVANEAEDYKTFRQTMYEREADFFRSIACDSRETIPITLALFRLAGGDVEKMVTYGANFGRDADTIATMGGAIAGAYQGIAGIRADWVEKARQLTSVDQDDLAERLVRTARAKFDSQGLARQGFAAIG
ncbi:ADP-ribosylglycohydrolase family protein [Chloroflexi bacterium TSY]|nr:ADP-ribosylglycohydrolase family protein [Chloroflexi bacterium TSY]